jgi:hypothetical protein
MHFRNKFKYFCRWCVTMKGLLLSILSVSFFLNKTSYSSIHTSPVQRAHLSTNIYTWWRKKIYSRTLIIRSLVIRITNCPDRLDPTGKFVKHSTKLTCLEIAGYWIKYSTVLWLLENYHWLHQVNLYVKHFLTLNVLHTFMVYIFPHLSNTYKELCINIFLYINKYVASNGRL